MAPFAAYNVREMSITGDATAGVARMSVIMDERYCSLISYVTFQDTQVTSADADFRVRIVAPKVATALDSGVITGISATADTTTVSRTWEPPPIVLPGGQGAGTQLVLNMLNVDLDVYALSLLIYLFDIRVRELTPMGPLLWARGSR